MQALAANVWKTAEMSRDDDQKTAKDRRIEWLRYCNKLNFHVQ
ncbi:MULTISPECIES: hypothetical protein [unclassified Acinetobacter]|nr:MULTISPECIES: hypothetical protein [unclassified Acinetobacter]